MNRALGLFVTLALVCRVGAADPVDGTERAPESRSLMTALTPLLVHWIERSRDAALEQGVEKIPVSIRAALEGYVPDKTLERVRWRAGGGGDLSLQQSAFFLKTRKPSRSTT